MIREFFKSRALLLLTLSALLSACGSAEQWGVEFAQSDEATASLLYVDPVLTPGKAAMKGRWIGTKALVDLPCPKAPRPYESTNLFGSDQDRDLTGGLPLGLRRYCLYEAPAWMSAGQEPVPAELQALLRPRGRRSPYLLAIEPDHQAVGAYAGASLGSVTEGVFSEEFDEHAGRLPTLPLRVPHRITASEQPRLGILDTVPTYEPVAAPETQSSNSSHGRALTHFAKRLVCDDGGNCSAKVSTQLAMPLISEQGQVFKDPVNGGFFGSIGWLAQAIRREVEAWEADRAEQKNGRLVLNLSLGWTPDYGGSTGTFASWPLDVQAVYSAIEDAHCRGALVVAAAGNRSNGPSGNQDPILPAAWETLHAPKRMVCLETVGRDYDVSLARTRTSYRPFLYAASGIDYKGAPLAITREGARARIGAYGDHAVTGTPSAGYTETLSGTSVSALVTSASAAAVWFYQPKQSLYDVMNYVYKAGVKVGTPADFCHASAVGCGVPTRRAEVCRAARKACGGVFGSMNCPGVFPKCEKWFREPAPLSSLDHTAFDGGASTSTLHYAWPTIGDPVCGTKKLAYTAGMVSSSECPEDQIYGGGAKPWAVPQPEGDPCPNCAAYISTDQVRLTNSYGFGSYASPTLSVTNFGGVTTNYGLGSLSGTNVNLSFSPSFFSGASSVSFSGVKSGLSYTSPIYLGF